MILDAYGREVPHEPQPIWRDLSGMPDTSAFPMVCEETPWRFSGWLEPATRVGPNPPQPTRVPVECPTNQEKS